LNLAQFCNLLLIKEGFISLYFFKTLQDFILIWRILVVESRLHYRIITVVLQKLSGMSREKSMVYWFLNQSFYKNNITGTKSLESIWSYWPFCARHTENFYNKNLNGCVVEEHGYNEKYCMEVLVL
jgi:hypothetical protein